MAQHQLHNKQGFVDKERAVADSAAVPGGSVTTPANYDSNTALDTRLLALGYTQAQLDGMTQNDKVYAVRLSDDADSL